MNPSFLEQLKNIISNQLSLIENRKYILHIPQSGDAYIADNRWHFHPTAELFIQVSGISEMHSTKEKILCRKNEMMLIPKTISHYEKVKPDKHTFNNIVVAFGRQTISIHSATEGEQCFPHINELEQFTSNEVANIYHYLDTVVALQNRNSSNTNNAMRGLLLTVLSLLLNNIENPSTHQRNESYKVTQCRRLVSEHLSNPNLNVIWLAKQISCSPDYLSHIFNKETGRPLTEHINDKRIDFAKELLINSPLNISEIAQACGYHDPGYMTRQFRKRNHESPRNYRNKTGKPIGKIV